MVQLPARFGPFEPVQRLGAGGMAETFVAVRRGPGGFEQRVCIKRILPAYAADQEFLRAFLSEARTSAALRHNNIVQVLDFGHVDDEGSHYLALELIDGLDLRGLLQAGVNFDPELTTLIASELAAALEYAHGNDSERAQVIHRDISPSNVLVSRAGEVKLTDFGIARVVGAEQRTATGVIKGKVPYMPPEYIQHGQFDQRGDLFALGVLMFELLTGERPFEGSSELDTLRRIVAGERRALPPDVPPALAHCIERAIAIDPRARFDSARTLLEALPPVAVARTRRRLSDIVRALVPSASTPKLPAPVESGLPRASEAPARPADSGPPAAMALRPSSGPQPVRAPLERAQPLAPTLYAPGTLESTRTALRSSKPSRAAVLTLLAAATLLGSVVGLVLLRLDHKSAAAPPALPPVESPRAPAVERVAPVATATPEAAPAQAPEATSALVSTDLPREARVREKRRVRTEPRGGSESSAELKVVVVPFGEVWIDEKYIGASPISVRLAPGAHVVGIGEGRARERRTVHLHEGEHEQLVFRPDAKSP